MVSKVAIVLLGLVALSAATPTLREKLAKYPPRHPKVTPNIKGLPFQKIVDTYKPSVLIPGYKTVADCGRSKYHGQDRIVGGAESTPNAWPWQVALFFDEGWFCGGSIISENWVLTAAHCVDGATGVEIIAGAHDLTASEATQVSYRSLSLKAHEDYGSILIRNDIALIEVAGPIAFTPEIQPVCLPSRADVELVGGESVTPTGWGKTHDGLGGISDVLMQVTVPTIQNSVCEATYGSSITDDVVCIDSTGGMGTCNGDSGGPLNYDKGDGVYCTRGITSFGASAGCEAGYPDAFTRVTHYLDWIETNTGIIIA